MGGIDRRRLRNDLLSKHPALTVHKAKNIRLIESSVMSFCHVYRIDKLVETTPSSFFTIKMSKLEGEVN